MKLFYNGQPDGLIYEWVPISNFCYEEISVCSSTDLNKFLRSGVLSGTRSPLGFYVSLWWNFYSWLTASFYFKLNIIIIVTRAIFLLFSSDGHSKSFRSFVTLPGAMLYLCTFLCTLSVSFIILFLNVRVPCATRVSLPVGRFSQSGKHWCQKLKENTVRSLLSPEGFNIPF